MKEVRVLISDYVFALKLAWQNAPKYILGYVCFTLLAAVAAFLFDVYFIAYIMHSLINKEAWSSILTACIVGAVIATIRIIAENFAQQMEIGFNQVNTEKINRMFYEHSLSYNLSDYYDANFYDKYSYVISNGPGNSNKSVVMLGNMMVAVVYTCFFVREVFVQDRMVIALMVVMLALKVIVELYINRKTVDIYDSNNLALIPHERRRDYFRRLFFTREYACDLKNNELFTHILKKYEDSVDQFKKQRLENGKKQMTWCYGQYIHFHLFQDAVVPIVLICCMKYAGLRDVSLYWQMSALFVKLSGLYFFQIIPDLRTLSKGITRVQEFLTRGTVRKNIGNDSELAELTLSLRNVSFSYDSNTDFSLKNINLEIPYGKKIAIVGRNGSGKTTLLNLLLGLYMPTSGELLLGGKDIKNFDKEQYRKMMGLLCQNFNLYYASVKDNIKMGDEATDEEVVQSAEYAHCLEFIKELEQGFDTKIGKSFDENAVELSGGQAQRIALARIFLSKAPLIYMDEPTAAVDLFTEELINNALMDRLKDKTVVVITHRLSITEQMDKIYVMDNGEVIEDGTFEELMNKESVFRDMYRLQNV